MMASQLSSHELYTVPLFLHNYTDILKLRQKVMSLQSQVQIAVPPEKKTFFDISLTKMQGVLIGMVSGMVFHSHPLNKFHKDQVNPSVLTNLTK